MTTPASPVVTIVGAGITGIGAAYYLSRRNIPYVILEARNDLGGVWNTQRWHGARCDSDIVKYSFSFNPVISDRSLHPRAEIQEYLRQTAIRFGILPHIRFGTRVLRAAFDSNARCWRIDTDRGSCTSQFLLNGNGYMSEAPYVPDFAGRAEFSGEVVHTAHLDGERTFEGKRVVVVGSGATAICCVPELADVSGSVVMLQRSPSYIHEIDNRIGVATRTCQALYNAGIRFPLGILRYALQLKDDAIFVGFRRFPRFAKWVFRRQWTRAVGAETVKEHFTPRYNPWEQRIPVAIGLKEKLQSGQVRIVTGEIERFVPSGLLLTNGETVPCDVCVLATGFSLDFLKFDLVVDGSPVSFERINFYKGLLMGAIPNYFHPVGVWHSAWTQRSESATRLAVDVIEYMKAKGFAMMSIDRKTVPGVPTITPNYITRHPDLPRIYGTLELPAIDRLLSFRFSPKPFRFS